ncbi:MAG TPA: sugar dehydratase [Spirochaeta sp.]|nr:sugar dehydratase [Spirochaeta sp.]
MKRILIIGGSYFLGRVFVEKLIENGAYDIYILNRGNIPFRNTFVNEILCDRHDSAALAAALQPERWDIVFDFCAYTAGDIRLMMTALSHSQTDRYILISTASVYAEQAPSEPLGEDAPLLAHPLTSDEDPAGYFWNKVLAENELRQSCTAAGIGFTILRPAIIFGKFNYAPRESYFFDRIIAGEDLLIPEPAGRAACFSFISVWDAAALIEGCIKQTDAADTCLNLAAPEQISYNRFADAIQQASNRDIAVKQLSIPELMRRQVQLPFPPDRSLLYSGTKIAKLLGHTYNSFEDEMKRTWKYYLAGRGIDPKTLKTL